MKFWQRYTFLLIVILNKLPAYSISDTLQLKHVADSLFHNENYYEAAIYYQKLDFFLRGETLKTEAKLLTANCYKLNKNYNSGIDQINTIGLEDAPDSLIFKVKYQCALMSYLNNDLPRAESFLEQLNYLVKDSSYVFNAMLLHAFVLNEQYKWPQAKEKLNRLNAHLNLNNKVVFDFTKQMIDSIYALKSIPKLKSVDKASRLSTFFPGLGQCYTKNYAEGLGSFLAITISAGAMVVGIVYQYYFTSIFVGNLLIGKFYLGGVKRAEFLAEKYNYLKAKDYNTRLRSTIKQTFTK